jgi:hypothetical protein
MIGHLSRLQAVSHADMKRSPEDGPAAYICRYSIPSCTDRLARCGLFNWHGKYLPTVVVLRSYAGGADINCRPLEDNAIEEKRAVSFSVK